VLVGPWWLWDFPPWVYAGLVRLEKRHPAAERGPTHGNSTSGVNISAGEPVLCSVPVASEQHHVTSWRPSWCPGRGVWDLAGVAWAGSHPLSGLRGADKGQGEK